MIFKTLHMNLTTLAMYPAKKAANSKGVRYTANVLLVNSTDCVGVTNPTVVQTYFQLILTTNLTMRKTVKATYFYCCIKELIMHIS